MPIHPHLDDSFNAILISIASITSSHECEMQHDDREGAGACRSTSTENKISGHRSIIKCPSNYGIIKKVMQFAVSYLLHVKCSRFQIATLSFTGTIAFYGVVSISGKSPEYRPAVARTHALSPRGKRWTDGSLSLLQRKMTRDSQGIEESSRDLSSLGFLAASRPPLEQRSRSLRPMPRIFWRFIVVTFSGRRQPFYDRLSSRRRIA